ncbi:uncharacterized protein si:ch211-142k18.1 [Dunckerocampus dactyliophorus]|uniref:uncharacterized protein si:ch211-142k18.1 n=1 Tax=Dunckerocampus dactyliophorus TaxID=161453 RepID=UPI002405E780|nr:uncharacterized protein si:ch211-142k18.1 [Dunckerocampus dactyliophorus]XP_054617050.1 uncharacterized protein si:ch211-142k18.1 [Dunckerocampus dactyliophorus]
MWCRWMPFIVVLVSTATPTICQSGDGDYGSGFDVYPPITATHGPLQSVADEPAGVTNKPASADVSALPPQEETCAVHFATGGVSARRLKAQKEELAYLQALQHANEAVMENLVQYVGAELGDQSYEEVIRANMVGIREDHKSCQEVTEKAERDLEKQLEGEVLDTLAGMQKIRDGSLAFEDMLRAASDAAGRLESSSQALHASFTKQPRDTVSSRGS